MGCPSAVVSTPCIGNFTLPPVVDCAYADPLATIPPQASIADTKLSLVLFDNRHVILVFVSINRLVRKITTHLSARN